MKRKRCDWFLIIGLVLVSLLFTSGYGESEVDKVQPNHFKKQKTTIDTDAINPDVNDSYHKISSQVRDLTFVRSHQDEQVKRELFLTSSEPEKVNVKKETERLRLFQ